MQIHQNHNFAGGGDQLSLCWEALDSSTQREATADSETVSR